MRTIDFARYTVITAAVTVLLAGCASRANRETRPVAVQVIPATSKLAKVSIGMSMQQVYDLIGTPNDTRTYSTGKVFIPFYFGSDGVRTEALYKGEGRIVFTGVGVTSTGFRVHQVVYDPSEDGYNNK